MDDKNAKSVNNTKKIGRCYGCNTKIEESEKNKITIGQIGTNGSTDKEVLICPLCKNKIHEGGFRAFYEYRIEILLKVFFCLFIMVLIALVINYLIIE